MAPFIGLPAHDPERLFLEKGSSEGQRRTHPLWRDATSSSPPQSAPWSSRRVTRTGPLADDLRRVQHDVSTSDQRELELSQPRSDNVLGVVLIHDDIAEHEHRT